MGFGRGILKDPRRLRVLLPGTPFGTVCSRTHPELNPIVLTPAGTASFTRPASGQLPVFSHDDPFELVPRISDSLSGGRPPITCMTRQPTRSVISDARDLFVQTLFEVTAQRSGQTLDPVQSPLLVCQNEPVDRNDLPAARAFVHIGRTQWAQELLLRSFVLQDEISRQRNDRQWEWRSDLSNLDSDGFVILAFTLRSREPEHHLIFLGGNEYGTYYAVATFLHQVAGARWLFPGKTGTVIPPQDEIKLDRDDITNRFCGRFFQVDEPDYRGRSLEGMVDGSLDQRLLVPGSSDTPTMTPGDINDMRNWLLRNRLHPSTERGSLFYRRNFSSDCEGHVIRRDCESLGPEMRKYLALESRIPTQHNLSRFFSPNSSTLDFYQLQEPLSSLQRIVAIPEMFPNPAPKTDPAPADVREGDRIAQTGQVALAPAIVGVCRSTNLCECNEEPLALDATRATLLASDVGHIPTRVQVPTIPNRFSQEIADRFAGVFSAAFQTPEAPAMFRYAPRTLPHTHVQDSRSLDDKWMPCLYVSQETAAGELAPFRETLARDLANQLVLALAMSRLMNGFRHEFSVSLAPNDGLEIFMCECRGCRLTNGVDGPNDQALLHKGVVIVANLERFRASRDQNNDRGIYYVVQSSAAQLMTRAVNSAVRLGLNGLPALERIPENQTGMTTLSNHLNRFALQGLIPDPGRPNKHARRVLDLLNRTAHFMLDIWPIPPEETQVTFHAYATYVAPPLFEKNPVASRRSFYSVDGTYPTEDRDDLVLHPSLIPIVAETRDFAEYDPYRVQPTASEGYRRLRECPSQFNLERWSLIARQTGMYEYLHGFGAVAPRLYTPRLQRALQHGYESARSRVFIGEGAPHMGLDAIKFYEVAQLLWDRNRDLNDLRGDYCTGLFGPNSQVVSAMRTYFDTLERAWANRPVRNQRTFDRGMGMWVDRPAPEQRLLGLIFAQFQGLGIEGRVGLINQLDYLLYDATGTLRAPTDARSPFFQAWDGLQRAYMNSPADSITRERVQYFRRAFGLVRELVLVYHPVLALWRTLEPYVEAQVADPVDWVAVRGVGVELRSTDTNANQILNNADTEIQRMRMNLRDGLRGINFTNPVLFRSTVREPIHRYFAETNVYRSGPVELEELGLGLGRYEGTFTPDFGSEQAQRQAFWTPLIKEYMNWWNLPATRAQPRGTPEQQSAITTTTTWSEGILPDSIKDEGCGTAMFWWLKRFMAAVMLASSDLNFRGALRLLADA